MSPSLKKEGELRPRAQSWKKRAFGKYQPGTGANEIPGVDVEGKGEWHYQGCNMVKPATWFTLFDCLSRCFRVVVAFYFVVATHPVSFFLYSLRYNMLWYGTPLGLLTTLTMFFVYPFVLMALVIAKKMGKMWCKHEDFDDGNVFFTPPDGMLAAFLWDWYKEMAPYVGLFIMCGNDADAVAHSWYDHKTKKDFWRGTLSASGAQVPCELARWDGEKLHWGDRAFNKDDVVVKLPDSYLGKGDMFLEYGKDFRNVAELEGLLRKEHPGKADTLVLTWIRPAVGTGGVHQLDILTVRTNRGVRVANCLFWGDCTGPTTHTCTTGYVCDVATEKIWSACSWYSPAFMSMDAKRIGQELPGLRESVARAIKAHESIEYPFLKMVGWDVILTDKGPVFFEGNFACHRIVRRIFLTWSNTFNFIRTHRNPLSF